MLNWLLNLFRKQCPCCGCRKLKSINFIRATIEVNGQRAPDYWIDYKCQHCGSLVRWHRRKWEDLRGGGPGRDEVPPPHDDLPPISRDDLKGLFDYLSRPDPAPCTHTFKETTEYIRKHMLPEGELLAWLQRNGAGCDCEVIFNTDAEWGEYAGREMSDEDA